MKIGRRRPSGRKGMTMAENALAKKSKLKPGQRAAFIGAPEGYLKPLQPLPAGLVAAEKLSGQFDWIQIFVKTQAEVDQWAPRKRSSPRACCGSRSPRARPKSRPT